MANLLRLAVGSSSTLDLILQICSYKAVGIGSLDTLTFQEVHCYFQEEIKTKRYSVQGTA